PEGVDEVIHSAGASEAERGVSEPVGGHRPGRYSLAVEQVRQRLLCVVRLQLEAPSVGGAHERDLLPARAEGETACQMRRLPVVAWVTDVVPGERSELRLVWRATWD